MKQIFLRVSIYFLTNCFLILVFSTSSFAMPEGGGKLPGWASEKARQKEREEQQSARAREATDGDVTDNSNQEQRGAGILTATEGKAAEPGDEIDVEELLTKSDEEVLSDLVDINIRQKFLSRMSDYQAEVDTFAQREPASASFSSILLLLNQLDGKMKAACNEDNNPGLLKEIRSAEWIYSVFEKEKEKAQAIHQAFLRLRESMPARNSAALNQAQAIHQAVLGLRESMPARNSAALNPEQAPPPNQEFLNLQNQLMANIFWDGAVIILGLYFVRQADLF